MYSFLYQNPFHLIESNFIAGTIVELGRAWRFMGRNCLSILDCAAVFQVCSNAGSSEGVAASGVGETHRERSPLYHPQHVFSLHRPLGHLSANIDGTE